MQNRQIEMLRTAIPYAAPVYRKPLQVFLQMRELSEYIRGSEESADIEACGMDNVGDIEGLMENLRQFCGVRERDMIDSFLNVIKVQNMYQCYKNYAGAFAGDLNNESRWG
mgnify:CR=1 FL=1